MLVKIRPAYSNGNYTVILSDGNPMREQVVSMVNVFGLMNAIGLAGGVANDNKAGVYLDPEVSRLLFLEIFPPAEVEV